LWLRKPDTRNDAVSLTISIKPKSQKHETSHAGHGSETIWEIPVLPEASRVTGASMISLLERACAEKQRRKSSPKTNK